MQVLTQALCTPQTSTTMAANGVIFPAEGTWTLFQGAGTIVDENDPNTIITDLGPGTNIFVWTITNGPCDNALDDGYRCHLTLRIRC